MVLVKVVLTAVAIHHITLFDLLVEVFKKIDSLRCAYLWARTDKVTGGKCKIYWGQVCKLEEFAGPEILNLGSLPSCFAYYGYGLTRMTHRGCGAVWGCHATMMT